MGGKLDIYGQIAVKYSNKRILSEAEVDDFYDKLPNNFTPDQIQVILTDLTDALYRHTQSDVSEDEAYSIPESITIKSTGMPVTFMIPVPEPTGYQASIDEWDIVAFIGVISEKVSPVNQLIGYGESHY